MVETTDDNVREKIDAKSNNPVYLCFVSCDSHPESIDLKSPWRQALHKHCYRGLNTLAVGERVYTIKRSARRSLLIAETCKLAKRTNSGAFIQMALSCYTCVAVVQQHSQTEQSVLEPHMAVPAVEEEM